MIDIKNNALVVKNATAVALEFMDKTVALLDPLTGIPLVGDSVKQLQDIVAMLNDYVNGRYRKIPKTAIIGAIGILAYIASPFDIIPDNIPVLGFIDDAFVITTVVDLCLERELERYRNWRAENAAE